MRGPDEISDSSRRLVARAQGGDRLALDTLLGKAQARLQQALHAKMGARLRAFEDSTDVMQSVLREAVRDFGQFQYVGRGSFQRWLLAIAEHKLRHRARDHGRARRNVEREVALSDDASVAANERDPAAAAVTAEVEAGVRAALESLDDDERDLIVWRQFQGLSTADVADVLAISVAAASKRYLRALQRLEGALAAHGVDRRR
jgi:RNA polymerase sigma-70 factor (ECF subfamily)